MNRGPGRVGGGNGIQDWLNGLPTITRHWLCGALLVTCSFNFQLLSGHSLVLLWEPLIKRFEIWRLVTPILFMGKFSFNFLIELYMIVQYSERYELGPFNSGGGGTTADYAWMLMLGAAGMFACAWIWGLMTLSTPMMYYWSTRLGKTVARYVLLHSR